MVLTRKPGRPKGSQNKTKSSPIKPVNTVKPTEKVAFNVEIIESEQVSDESDEDTESAEALEIFNSASQILQNAENQETSHRTTLNLLPSNDILDQIVQDTGS